MIRIPENPRPVRRLAAVQPASLAWLTFVWVVLWGELSLLMVIGGFLVAVVVTLVFPMPVVRMHVRVRPVWLAWLVLHFLWDVVLASTEVAWKTLTLPRPRNAVIAVTLRSDSSFVMTLVSEMTTLVPGSVVVEVRRSTRTLFLHVFDAIDEAGIEDMRRRTLALERRVVRALGADTTAVDGPEEAA